ncbi:thiosulfate/3-mercaptopyruvate sulfurtransferase [Rhodococcus sp. 27YEA15]|uniref:sulfurtransferase n=1 Tax=Rhodococcus sp. 27YEA15 TaxID=3156259 RepID=UPI003C7BFB94
MTKSPLIGAQALHQLLRADGVVVLDATVHFPAPRFDGDYRPESGYGGWLDAHIPGSRHVDLMSTMSARQAALHFTRPSAEQLQSDLAEFGVEAGSTIVVYDQGSMTWASRLWWVLRNAGIDAQVLDGGIAAWAQLALPVETGVGAAPAPASTRWNTADLGLWADKDQVAAISNGAAVGTLVCALSSEQFEGTERTRYSRRGHIPTSLNISAKSLLDDDGRLLPLPEVATRTEPVLRDRQDPVVIYCGGGVSACLTALALVSNGHGDVKIYDGSLEEWTADMAAPLVVSGAAGDQRCR